MADQRIQYTEELVGANHAVKTDTINRLSLVEHNNDGTHKSTNIYTDLVAKRPWVDVRAFGATGDGVTDDTTAIQDAINYAATNGLNVYAPEGHYKFTRLYLHYHATSNPGWPQTAGYEGKVKFFGDGAVGYNFLIPESDGPESTDATGPLSLDGTGVSQGFQLCYRGCRSSRQHDSVLDIDIANYFHTRLLSGRRGPGCFTKAYCVSWT